MAIMPPTRGTLRIACGYRQDNGQDDGRERRVRSEDENAAGTEHGVCEQRHDGRVETIDARQPRRFRIRNAHRHEHRRHDEAGDDVVTQPGCLVVPERRSPGTQRIQPVRFIGAPGRTTRPVSGSGETSNSVIDALSRTAGGAGVPQVANDIERPGLLESSFRTSGKKCRGFDSLVSRNYRSPQGLFKGTNALARSLKPECWYASGSCPC